MSLQVLTPEQKKQFEAIQALLQACLSLIEKSSDPDAMRIVRERLIGLQSAALFVIVGEVKSGKSSFVNALLGENICEVAPDPCTAVIQELVYGEERTGKNLGDKWERVTLPKEVLKEITIVDTPGTNSIIQNHQTITEKYIPLSDLVIFVFPAKNPHTGSSWEFLSLIRKDWHRKMVFVLQQSDLASPEELDINRERVLQYARERNVQKPMVFCVSAKWETEGGGDSGFEEFRNYLRSVIQSGEVWKMKVDGTRDTVVKIVENLITNIKSEQAAIADDRVFYDNLLDKVRSRRNKAAALRRLAVDSLCVSYDRLASKLEQSFTDGLGLATILRRTIPFVRDKNVKTWLKDIQIDFEKISKEEIEIESQRVSKDLSDEMQSMFSELSDAIVYRQNVAVKSFTLKDPDRYEILARLQQQLKDLRISDITGEKGIQSSNLGKLSLAGGGITALGAVIAFATNMVIFDITGGILAIIGAGMVAVTLVWKRSAIIRQFKEKMQKSRDEFRERLDTEITRMFEKIFMELENRLNEPISKLDEKAKRLGPLLEEGQKVMEMTEKI
jgi:GTPase Era involved in 16S rRNA processing